MKDYRSRENEMISPDFLLASRKCAFELFRIFSVGSHELTSQLSKCGILVSKRLEDSEGLERVNRVILFQTLPISFQLGSSPLNEVLQLLYAFPKFRETILGRQRISDSHGIRVDVQVN
jgi:hypothetical protein